MPNTNYYDILGVTYKATSDEITAAKNKLAKKYHPDVNMRKGIDTTEKMQEILEAYAVLSDKEKRTEYDQCHLDKDDPNRRICENTYPAIFL